MLRSVELWTTPPHRTNHEVQMTTEANLVTPRKQFKILIAGDSPLYRKLLKDTLSGEEYTVIVATDGNEALELIAEHRPTVLITDWDMPDITGIELCAR